jgi:nucleoside-diphosphate-sugar epimerase
VRVFLAGATGALGRPLVERLLAAGHEVTGMTRRPDRAEALRARGLEAAVADAYDADAVRAAVVAARPEVVVNALTDIPADLNPRRYAQQMAGNDRIRREAGPHLVAAAEAAGARRIVAESIAFAYAPGPGLAVEGDALWHDAPGGFGRSTHALEALESAVLGSDAVEGVVLRFGWFYGPGTGYGPGGGSLDMVRRRRFPVIGDGAGVFSWIHVDDAAAATVRALDHGPSGVYNVVDDEPAPARVWLPDLADALGAPKPGRVPAWVARIAAGPFAVASMTRTRGASNARAKTELGWAPAHASWRQGFRAAG